MRFLRFRFWGAASGVLALAWPSLGHAGVELEDHQLWAGATLMTYLLPVGSFPVRYGAGVSYDVGIGQKGEFAPLRIGGGLRSAVPFAHASVPLEAYLRVRLSARIGPWVPAAGPELGVSGFAHSIPVSETSNDGLLVRAQEALTPFYLAFDAAPLRFAFGRFRVSAMEVQVGSTIGGTGSAERLQLDLLDLGLAL